MWLFARGRSRQWPVTASDGRRWPPFSSVLSPGAQRAAKRIKKREARWCDAGISRPFSPSRLDNLLSSSFGTQKRARARHGEGSHGKRQRFTLHRKHRLTAAEDRGLEGPGCKADSLHQENPAVRDSRPIHIRHCSSTSLPPKPKPPTATGSLGQRLLPAHQNPDHQSATHSED